ncbi:MULTISPECIES: signal peptidase I [Bacillus cereus group]|uniref:Signal peptidase I n=2 Tax=Bacillus cereus group TaxID=86661 RepID=A0A9X6MG60_BACTJ|nr:signal peptidase I [Bacillus thuringiensis]OUB76992.1 signal peptidase I [Bacillus thuringiensis serovar jegathesan]
MKKNFLFKRTFYISFLITCAIYYFLSSFVFGIYPTKGESMQPTLLNDDRLLVSKLNHKVVGFKRFDLIQFYSEKQNKHFVKRVIGLPGECIEYKNDNLYIDGIVIEEPFIAAQKESPNKYKDNTKLINVNPEQLNHDQKRDLDIYIKQLESPYYTMDFKLEELYKSKRIPDNFIFVLGDNRPLSDDSRYSDIGLVPISSVEGKILLRLTPNFEIF